MRASLLREKATNAQVLQLMLRYTQALFTQMAQMGVCNRHHSVDQQLCRWLLLSLDRHGLEQRTCECYEVVKTEYDRLLPRPARHEFS